MGCFSCCKAKCAACEHCFQNFSAYFLVGLNVLTAFIGLACIGSGAYFWYRLGNLTTGLVSYSSIGPVAFGVFLFLLSIFGYCGVRRKSRLMLAIYFVLMLILTILLAAAGVILLLYAGYFENAELSSALSDFQISVYDKCCVEPGFSVDTIVSCTSNPAPPCYKQLIPISDDVCNFLETVEVSINGSAVIIVGNSTEGGCGGDDGFASFETLFSELLKENFMPIGIGYICLVALLLLVLASACAVFCKKKDEFVSQTKRPAPTKTAKTDEMQVHRAGSLL